MKTKIAGVALAAAMACALGGTQRAEAALIDGFGVTGSGQGTISFSSEDPNVTADYYSGIAVGGQVTGHGTGYGNAGYLFGIIDPNNLSASGSVTIGRYDLGYYSDFANGYQSFSASVDGSDFQASGSYYNNNISGDSRESFSGSFIFSGKVRRDEYQGKTLYVIIAGSGFENATYTYYTDGNGGSFGPYQNVLSADLNLNKLSGSLTSQDPFVLPLPPSAPLFGGALLLVGSIGYMRRRRKVVG